MATFPDRDEAVVAALDKERVPCAPVLSLEEAMDHPHLRERKTMRHASDPPWANSTCRACRSSFPTGPTARI